MMSLYFQKSLKRATALALILAVSTPVSALSLACSVANLSVSRFSDRSPSWAGI